MAIILRARVAHDPADPVVEPPSLTQTGLQKIYIKDLKLRSNGRKTQGWFENAILKMGRCCLHIQLVKQCPLGASATPADFIFEDRTGHGRPKFILTSSPSDVVRKTLSMLDDPFLAASACDVIAMAGEWAVSSHPQLRAITDAVIEHKVRETISAIQDSRFDARDLQRLGKFVKNIGTHFIRQYRTFYALDQACISQWKLQLESGPKSMWSEGNATIVPAAWQPQEAESVVRPFLECFRGLVFVAEDLASQEMFDKILFTLFGCLEQLADNKVEWAASSGNIEEDCKAVDQGILYSRPLIISHMHR
jgi:hypothetical protein